MPTRSRRCARAWVRFTISRRASTATSWRAAASAISRAAGLKLAVASTTSRPNVDTLLRINFPQGDVPFDVIACGDEAARKKPAPDVFDLALRRLGVAPSEAVAFEDSAAGIRSALDAGLPVVATRSRYTESHRLDGAFSAVSDLGEPGAPHRHLSGHVWPEGLVSLAALRAWHARVTA
jgi:beta-phosphoglucomutase-like phosphatase (HAD superfamily)